MNFLSEHNEIAYIIVAACIISILTGFIAGSVIQKIKNNAVIKKERKDAVKRSRAVLGGQFGEQLAPFLPEFPCNPGDAHFLGKPVDYVAFPGSAEGTEVREVLFIEVKSGASALSQREKQIKKAVEEGRVRYVEYRLQ